MRYKIVSRSSCTTSSLYAPSVLKIRIQDPQHRSKMINYSYSDDIKYIWWNNPNLKVDYFSLIFPHRNKPVEKYSHPRQCQGVERADHCNHNNAHKPSSPQYFDTSGGRVCFSRLSLLCTGHSLDTGHTNRNILTTENIITMPMLC